MISILLFSTITIQGFTIYNTYYNLEQITNKNDIYEELTLLQYNAYHLNKNYKAISEYIIENHEKLDIIFLQEVTEGLKKELKKVEQYYPYKITNTEEWFDRAFYSKIPIVNYKIKFFDDLSVDLKAIDPYYNSHIHYMVINLNTTKHLTPFVIYGIHANAPLSKKFAEFRNNELSIIADEIKHNNLVKHKILVGDLNTTPFSYWYKLLEDSSGLHSSEKGTGIHNTWPSWLPFNLLQISIDNAMVSNNIIVKERITGKSLGSDHLPIILKLDIISHSSFNSK